MLSRRALVIYQSSSANKNSLNKRHIGDKFCPINRIKRPRDLWKSRGWRQGIMQVVCIADLVFGVVFCAIKRDTCNAF